MPEMWAQVPETEGGSCDCSDPVKEALCRDPNLRGLSPVELAHAVGVSPMQAQRTILDMAAKLTGRHVFQTGLSLDDALSIGGSPSARKPIIQAPEAGAIGDDRPGPVTVGGVTLDPVSIVLGVILGAIGYSLLGSSSSDDEGDEEEDEDE
jgi:hypothetical protein